MKPTYTLGDGWSEIEDRNPRHEYSGPKYADLGLYRNGVCILPLRIDHYNVELDGDVHEVKAALQKLIAELG